MKVNYEDLPTSPFVGLRVLHIGFEGQFFERVLPKAEFVTANSNTAMNLLRKHSFDIVLLQIKNLESLPIDVAAIRTVAADQMGVVVYGSEPVGEILAGCSDVEMDEYLCISPSLDGETDSHAQVRWGIKRTLEGRRHRIVARQWQSRQQQMTSKDQYEALHLLRAQRSALLDLAWEAETDDVPQWLVNQFADILRSRLMTTSADVTEVSGFVTNLQQGGVTLIECLVANSVATERIILGLGQRPAWFALGQSHILTTQVMWLYQNQNEIVSQ